MRGRFQWRINNKRIQGSTFRMGKFHRNQSHVCIWMNSGRRRLSSANCRHRHQVVCVRNPVRGRERPQRKGGLYYRKYPKRKGRRKYPKRKGGRKYPKRKGKKDKVMLRNVKKRCVICFSLSTDSRGISNNFTSS